VLAIKEDAADHGAIGAVTKAHSSNVLRSVTQFNPLNAVGLNDEFVMVSVI